jgi:glucose-1-phosphate thymidylyltransferase
VRGEVDDASVLTGAVVIEAGAEIANSTVHGPAIVGAGTVIRDSTVGPFTSIGPRCTISDSELEHSVLLEGAHIAGVHRIADSLVGRGARVVRSDEQPLAYRLLVADHSDIRVR